MDPDNFFYYFVKRHEAGVNSISFSPSSNALAFGTDDGKVFIHLFPQQIEIEIDNFSIPVTSVCLSNDCLVFGSVNGVLSLLYFGDPVQGIQHLDMVHPIESVDICHRTGRIAYSNQRGSTFIITPENHREVFTFPAEDVDNFAFSKFCPSDFNLIGIATRDGSIVINDLRTPAVDIPLVQPISDLHAAAQSLEWCPLSGRHLSASDTGNSIAIWDIRYTTDPIHRRQFRDRIINYAHYLDAPHHLLLCDNISWQILHTVFDYSYNSYRMPGPTTIARWAPNGRVFGTVSHDGLPEDAGATVAIWSPTRQNHAFNPYDSNIPRTYLSLRP